MSDIHAETAAAMFGVPVDQVTSDMRARGRVINYFQMYQPEGRLCGYVIDPGDEEARPTKCSARTTHVARNSLNKVFIGACGTHIKQIERLVPKEVLQVMTVQEWTSRGGR